MLRELGDDNYNNKSTFDCTIYYRVTGIAILRHTISYLSALDLSACCCNKVKEQWRSQPENLVMLCKCFCVYRLQKASISKEMNNDNDLNLHSMTKLSGWLRYCKRG